MQVLCILLWENGDFIKRTQGTKYEKDFYKKDNQNF
jgi:hypothetical protein